MYGKYNVPFRIEQEGISLSIEKTNNKLFTYSRTCTEDTLEKSLIINKSDILVHPVEPLNTPKVLTPYLLIEFDKGLLVEPKLTKKIFLTFPIEIAVFLRINKEFTVLDRFSLVKQKFTLYGDPKNGVVCKYWKSPISETMPSPSPFREGILELSLSNANHDWEQVTKAVFNAYGMKVFYHDHQVAMKASMALKSNGLAETMFSDSAPESGMKRSLDTFIAKKISMAAPTFTMEYGL